MIFNGQNANLLEFFFRLASHGKRIIGWDDEWGVEWTQNTLKYGGAAAYQKLNQRHTKNASKNCALEGFLNAISCVNSTIF